MTVTARSASDRTDDWPFWMIWDGSLNITNRVGYALTQGHAFKEGQVFVLGREEAESMAEAWNAWSSDSPTF